MPCPNVSVPTIFLWKADYFKVTLQRGLAGLDTSGADEILMEEIFHLPNEMTIDEMTIGEMIPLLTSLEVPSYISYGHRTSHALT